MKKKLIIILSSIIFLSFIIYGVVGFYVAYSILKIDHTCGWHENSNQILGVLKLMLMNIQIYQEAD